MAILMGANTRTYKFALGHALLALAAEGRDSATLAEIAVPYSLAIAQHSQQYPQAPRAGSLGEADYLSIVAQEADDTLTAGAATERLMAATVRSMPGMVMSKFHNLRGTDGVPRPFYEMPDRSAGSLVRFTPDLRQVAQSPYMPVLQQELVTRWALVESAFDADIGSSLVRSGLLVSDDSELVLDLVRRAPVAQTRPAPIGFQYGRCFYCRTPLDGLLVDVHVDHVYPYSLMTTGAWRGPDLNGVWNLVVACAPCNPAKSNRTPTEAEGRRLIQRNEAILASPHPLKRTVSLLLNSWGHSSTSFYRWVDDLAHFRD
jgi:5-methylcytosine-specific restriction endonuclease McrA